MQRMGLTITFEPGENDAGALAAQLRKIAWRIQHYRQIEPGRSEPVFDATGHDVGYVAFYDGSPWIMGETGGTHDAAL